jgi:hypothetical protein
MVKNIVENLSDMEREWLSGWQGVTGAAFNCVATDLLRKGLLRSNVDWNLSPLGVEVLNYIKEHDNV